MTPLKDPRDSTPPPQGVVTLTLRLSPAETLPCGSISTEECSSMMFHGWIELMAAINQLRFQATQGTRADADRLRRPELGS
jgi:hypothetical protein